MGYIGHSPTNAGSYIEVDDFGSSFNGSNVAFTLQVGSVDITPNQQNLLVILDGVVQQPLTAYSVSGSTITFTEAPANGTDLYCVLMGQSASIGQGTIGADELKISGNGTSGQLLKSDGDGTYSYLNQTSVTSGTATTLATARTINGVSFDGSANITVTADANTLSNTTLKSTVVNSSLTSVGTLTSLTVDNVIINGTTIGHTGDTDLLTFASSKLTVAGDVKVDGGNALLLREDDTYINSPSSDRIDFRTNGTVALYIDSSQDATFASDVNVTADGARFFVSSADYELVSIGRAGSSGSALDQAYIRLKNAGTNTVALHTAGNSYFNGGNVGIGTDSPGYQLDLRRNDTGTATSLGIRQLGTGDASMAFQTTTSPYGFCIGVDGSDSDAFKFATGTDDVGTNTKLTITTSGNVGVGTTSPSTGLHLSGGDNTASKLTLTNTAPSPDNTWTLHPEYNSQDLTLSEDSTARVTFKSGGNVSIGGTGGYQKLTVQGGHIYMSSGYNITWENGNATIGESGYALNFKTYDGSSVSTALNLYGDNTAQFHSTVYPSGNNTINLGTSGARWSVIYTSNSVNVSDETTKKYITDCSLGVDFINTLKPKSYKMKGLKEGHDDYNRKHFGLIAQDLIDTELNDSVFGDKDGEYSLAYNDIIAPLIKAVQELSDKNNALEARVVELENA